MGILDIGRNFFNNLPVAGGIFSSLWGDPEQEGMQNAFKQSRQDLAKQRMYNMDGRMNAMQQAATAFGPRNQMLGQMMGQQGPAFDMSQILQNPMSGAQQEDIRSAAFGAQQQKPQISMNFPQVAASPNTPQQGGANNAGMGTGSYYNQNPWRR